MIQQRNALLMGLDKYLHVTYLAQRVNRLRLHNFFHKTRNVQFSSILLLWKSYTDIIRKRMHLFEIYD